jgi:hypothetical protein
MKLVKGERRQITKALKALAACQALIAGDLPAPLLQKLRLDKGDESPEEASDQILIRLLRLEDALKSYLIHASSRKGRASYTEPKSYLAKHYIKCKNPKCQCRTDPQKRHGPYWMGSVRYGKNAKVHWYHLGACSKLSREAALLLLQDYAEGRKVKGLPKEPAQAPAAPAAQPRTEESPEDLTRGLSLAIEAAQAAEIACPAPVGPAELPEQLQKGAQKKGEPRPAGAAPGLRKPGSILANLPPAIQEKIRAQDEAQKGKPLKGLLPAPSAPNVLRIWEPAQACLICLKPLGVKDGSVISYETIEQPVHYSCLLKLAVLQVKDPGICKIVYHLNEADIIKVDKILRRQKK